MLSARCETPRNTQTFASISAPDLMRASKAYVHCIRASIAWMHRLCADRLRVAPSPLQPPPHPRRRTPTKRDQLPRAISTVT
eukprot:2647512-Rhodomonas_salina.2